MANFTRQAIIDSFLKLLSSKPLSKITVREIVEDCGVNRNTFYYHFRDIPALVEVVFMEDSRKIIDRYSDIESLEDCVIALIDNIIFHKKAVANLFRSSSKDIYETFLWNMSDFLVRSYLKKAFPDTSLPADDLEVAIKYIKCSMFGLVIDWINSGMKTDAKQEFHRYCTIWPDITRSLIRNPEK